MQGKKKVFISNVYEDKHFRDQIADWFEKGRMQNHEPVFETEDTRQDGPKGIKKHLSPKIAEADVIIALIGDNSHNHPWVDWEVAHARSLGIPVIPVRLPKTSGAGPREIRNKKMVRYSPRTLQEALNKIE